MKTNYNTTEDFLMDDSFIRWVLQPNEELNIIWNDFVKDYPQKNNEIKQAKDFLFAIRESDTTFDKEVSEERFNEIWRVVQISQQRTDRKKITPFPYYLKRIAATLIVLLGLSAVMYFVFYNDFMFKEISGTQIPLAVNPDKIQLVLGDGSIVTLDDEEGKEIVSAKEVRATMVDDKTLKYQKTLEKTEEVKYNILMVPKGRKLRIVLSDGTRVWLNSGSKLKYPTVFTEDVRLVQLKGEAYFEVAKDTQKPFIVQDKNVSIRVLGTSFNISNYENEILETVLNEGSVHMYRNRMPYTAESSILLMPNQKASYYSAHDNIIVDNVDAYKYTSWKDGILIFRNESFLSLSKKIERWYDVNISFVNEELKNLRFTGVIREGKTIEHILTLIQSTNPISFEINGQNIILDKKENE